MNPSDILRSIASQSGRFNADCIIDGIDQVFNNNDINKLLNYILCGHTSIYLNNHQRILLINGFIKHHHHNSSLINFVDIIDLIIEFYNDQVFLWHLDENCFEENYIVPVFESHPFSFRLVIYPTGYVSRHSQLNITNSNHSHVSLVDIGLYVYPKVSFSYGLCRGNFGHQLIFIKFYYEMYSEEIHKLSKSMHFKGVKKYRQFKYGFTFREFIVPRKYIKTSELMKKKNIDIKMSINYLCVQYKQNGCNNTTLQPHYFEDIKIRQSVKYEWNINVNKVSTLKNVKNNDELILFSNNFDNDNWSLFCKHRKKQIGKNGKPKFFIGLMLLKLPWYLNFIRIEMVIECNSNKKELNGKLWTGFESSLQIPFKSEVLEKSSKLVINVTIKIIKAYNSEDKLIESTEWKEYNII